MSVPARSYTDEGFGRDPETGTGTLLIASYTLATGTVDDRHVDITHAGDYVKVELEGADDPALFRLDDMVAAAAEFLDADGGEGE